MLPGRNIHAINATISQNMVLYGTTAFDPLSTDDAAEGRAVRPNGAKRSTVNGLGPG